MRPIASWLLAALLSVPALMACGSDEGKRGLAPPESDEVAAPESMSENKLSEAQRDQQNELQEEQAEAQDFDAAEMSP